MEKSLAFVEVVYDGGTHATEVWVDNEYFTTIPYQSPKRVRELWSSFDAGVDIETLIEKARIREE